MVEKLRKVKLILPPYSKFNDPNHLIIDTQMDILEDLICDEDELRDNEELSNDLGETGVSEASQAFAWLEGDIEDDELLGGMEEDINNLKEEKSEESQKKSPNKKEKNETEKFRTRWMRWLGQKCRLDKENWVTLLDSGWMAWVSCVYHKHGIPYKPLGFMVDRVVVYMVWQKAIEVSDMNDMHKLDGMYCTDNMEKKYR